MDELFALMSFLSHMHFQDQLFKQFCWMSLLTLADKTIPRNAAHTAMQIEFLPHWGMRKKVKIRPFSFSTAGVSVQKAAVPMVTLVVTLFLAGLHTWLLLDCAGQAPRRIHFSPHAMSAAGGFLARPGSVSWKVSDSVGCSGFLESAMVSCYMLLGCTDGAFCSLKASFHINPTH